jgi:hypothetical protein
VDELARAVFNLICSFFEHFTRSIISEATDLQTTTVLRHLLALTSFDEPDGSREIATMPLLIWSLLSDSLVDAGLLDGSMEEQKSVWSDVFGAFVRAARAQVQWPPKEEVDGWPNSKWLTFLGARKYSSDGDNEAAVKEFREYRRAVADALIDACVTLVLLFMF